MRPRLSPLCVALLAGLLCASCSAGYGGGYRSSDAFRQCDDPRYGAFAFPCGLRDRDGFDRSDRHRDHPDHNPRDHNPPPFAGKDS